MKIIKEPKNVDFSMRSEPWSDKELKELSAYILKEKTAAKMAIKSKNAAKSSKVA